MNGLSRWIVTAAIMAFFVSGCAQEKATILDLAGISIDSLGEVPLPGHSLKPVFKEERDQQHPYWFYHQGNRAMRLGDWKLVAAKKEPWELFNLSSDRTESNNLAAGNPDKVLKLEKQWLDMLDEIREVAPQKSIENQKVSLTAENLN